MKDELFETIEALKKITNNFEDRFHGSTLMGWDDNFDKLGRPLNTNPNYRTGEAHIEGKLYTYIRRGWKVRIWEGKAHYTQFMSNEDSYIVEVDLTPDYLKE